MGLLITYPNLFYPLLYHNLVCLTLSHILLFLYRGLLILSCIFAITRVLGPELLELERYVSET